jgi:SPP1 family predicted phage head-tail adaptor
MRRLGRLTRRIDLLRKVEELDSLGRQKRDADTWQLVASVWAEVRELNGVEIEKAKQMVATASIAIAIRYREGVTVQMRVRFKGRTMEIRSVVDSDSSQRELVLLCGEIK